MYFFGKKPNSIMIECDKCGKVYVYDEKYFSVVEDNYCISNTLINCANCGNVANANAKFCEKPKSVVNQIRCAKCGCTDCQPINETETSGGGYNAEGGCCGFLLLGPIGLLCGACGSGAETTNTLYWVCKKCGHKFKK